MEKNFDILKLNTRKTPPQKLFNILRLISATFNENHIPYSLMGAMVLGYKTFESLLEQSEKKQTNFSTLSL